MINNVKSKEQGWESSTAGLLLIVEKQPWGNTLEVTQKVEAALEALKPGLKGCRHRSDVISADNVHPNDH